MDDATTTAQKDKTTDSKDANAKQAAGAFAILPDEIIELYASFSVGTILLTMP